MTHCHSSGSEEEKEDTIDKCQECDHQLENSTSLKKHTALSLPHVEAGVYQGGGHPDCSGRQHHSLRLCPAALLLGTVQGQQVCHRRQSLLTVRDVSWLQHGVTVSSRLSAVSRSRSNRPLEADPPQQRVNFTVQGRVCRVKKYCVKPDAEPSSNPDFFS